MKKKRLKKRSRELYLFLCEFYKNSNRFPTMREVVAGTDITSTSNVYFHYCKLWKHNLLGNEKVKGYSKFFILGGSWQPPEAYYQIKYGGSS